jgi:hypothetical protein
VRVMPDGVYVTVNDHIQLDASGNQVAASEATETLSLIWTDVLDRGRTLVQHTITLV